MQVTITVASALALIFAATTTVSAQQPPSEACGACLYTAMVSASPTCNPTIAATSNPPSAMTPEEKSCFCPLASDASASWLQPCIADGCAAADIMPMIEKFMVAKDEICADGTVPPSATTAPPATTALPATTSASVPVTTSAAPATTSVRPSNATSATPTPTKPVSKNGGAGGLLFGSSNKVVAGAALAIASVAAILL
ncbi:hypothetical protein BGZ91_012347 [Linnemannia elongata]|nr:hypothetical protein BGZ91_012347 [Linnemannia elongata]